MAAAMEDLEWIIDRLLPKQVLQALYIRAIKECDTELPSPLETNTNAFNV